MPTINRTAIGYPKRKGSDKPSYKEYKRFYGDKTWRNERDNYLSTHPLCQCCLEHDRITPATAVHHIVPWSRGVDEDHKWKLFLERENFMSICPTCHRLLHIKDSKIRQERLNHLTTKEYEDGWGLKFMK